MGKEFLFLPALLAFETTCVSKKYSSTASTDLTVKVCIVRKRFLHVLERYYTDLFLQTVAFSNKYDHFYQSSETHSLVFSDSSQMFFKLCSTFFPTCFPLLDQGAEILQQA